MSLQIFLQSSFWFLSDPLLCCPNDAQAGYRITESWKGLVCKALSVIQLQTPCHRKASLLQLDFPPSPYATNIHAREFKINIVTILTYFLVLSQVNVPGGLAHLLWDVFCTDMDLFRDVGLMNYLSVLQLEWSGAQKKNFSNVIFKDRLPNLSFSLGFLLFINKNNFQHHMCRYRGLPRQVGLKAALV